MNPYVVNNISPVSIHKNGHGYKEKHQYYFGISFYYVVSFMAASILVFSLVSHYSI